MKKYSIHIIWAVVVVVALVGGWYYGKSMASSGSGGGRAGAFSSSTRGFAGRTGGTGAGGGFASGVVTAKDAQSITLQLPNGNSEVVFYSTSTAIVKPISASISDIAIGANVSVGGSANSDGSVTASTIQVRGANLPGSGGAGGSGAGAPTSGQ